ncbi:MAG: TRAP transporter TatT component family protein [Candidatus Bipolaricaulota bacterium]
MRNNVNSSRLFFLVFLFLLFCLICNPGKGPEATESDQLRELIDRADEAASKARNELRTKDQLEKAIRIYKKGLKLDPDNAHALNRLSLGYFVLAETYLDSEKEETSAYDTGYDYGLKSLRTNEDFDNLYEKKGFKALKELPESVVDVEGLFWTGANLGRLSERKGALNSLGNLPALISVNRRVLELDEEYLGGGAHRALGSIAGEILGHPFSFLIPKHDLSWEGALNHFERAIEIAPECLENYFSYAKYYALKKGKKDRARELIDKVLSRPTEEGYPLINSIAKDKARDLKNEKYEDS